MSPTNPLVRLAVRREVVNELRRDLGREPSADEIKAALSHVTDDVIDHATEEAGVVVPAASGGHRFGDGKVIAWIAAHKDEIGAIVKIILAVIPK